MKIWQQLITEKIDNELLNWFGHVMIMTQARLVKRIIEAKQKVKENMNWQDRLNGNKGKERYKIYERIGIKAKRKWKHWYTENL